MSDSAMVKIKKVENGYIVECCVPYKAKGDELSYQGEMEKELIAKDEAEVGKLVSKLLPLLDGEFSEDKAFDKAFGEAVRG